MNGELKIEDLVLGSGKAAVGTATDHCGRAMEAAGTIGQLVEIRILPHRHV